MDFSLTEEQIPWRNVARKFVEQVIKPDVLRRDRLPTAAERILSLLKTRKAEEILEFLRPSEF